MRRQIDKQHAPLWDINPVGACCLSIYLLVLSILLIYLSIHLYTYSRFFYMHHLGILIPLVHITEPRIGTTQSFLIKNLFFVKKAKPSQSSQGGQHRRYREDQYYLEPLRARKRQKHESFSSSCLMDRRIPKKFFGPVAPPMWSGLNF